MKFSYFGFGVNIINHGTKIAGNVILAIIVMHQRDETGMESPTVDWPLPGQGSEAVMRW